MLATNRSSPDPIGFLLLDRFSMMAFTSAVEPLRVANRMAGRELYRWRVFSLDGRPVEASNGLSVVAHQPFGAGLDVSSLIVVASFEPERHLVGSTMATLRRLARHGVALGAADTGAWPLAAAGLLDGYRITLHWEAAPAFAAAFPKVELSPKLYQIDRDRFTSAGGTSSFDMMLFLIGRRHGETIARSVAEQLVSGALRAGDVPQRPELAARLGVRDRRLRALVAEMERDPASTWSLTSMADFTGLPVRSLTSLFRREIGTSPHRFILQLRLNKARQRLAASDLPVRDIAFDCGFASLEHFGRSFRRHFGTAPSAARSR
ncbi:MAG TPA: GlxA family transcriptional regulator [Geminicoccus sp.]|uniref:GlxA family transcriptional regulator n=1 Tax=Geminicoccus sp. TaxID=2024832 RepID=UPI002E33142F|nr:GlxA family transcriptional regulator [Geminicoccus sp.]HEX2526470.1 GlxA family transcriptional regulator [Geminicoccus sp.]